MRRRGPGVAGLKKRREQRQALEKKAAEIEGIQLEAMKEQLVVFKSNLESFARKHKKDINKDPVLRKRFHQMCQSIGVDPLASNKGFWAQMLGVGDFYYELAVQIIEVCLRTRAINGGLIDVQSLCEHLNRNRSKKKQQVSADDVERSVQKVKILGSGFGLVEIGVPPNKSTMLQSVPLELNRDHAVVLELAQKKGVGKGFVSQKELMSSLSWDATRALQALEFLEYEGMAWIDDGEDERLWWFPSLAGELLSK